MLPVVILPHDGPNSRDEYEFHWLAQFLAVRGFAVLQPQFRGSIGFGRKLELAGDRQWGRLMQDDLSDGVKALIEQGVAEAGRVCIVGDGPYAGFAALAGAALTPELYACAVSVDGVSDASRYYGYVSTHTEGSDFVYGLRDFIGSPTDAQLIAKSPLRNADHVKAPVLLLYSVDGGAVAPDQSEAMAAALGTRAKLIRLPGDLPWQWRTDTRIRVLKEIEEFLYAHMPASHPKGNQ
jgi:dipeptidyl aminopeptidase/acylaminoacyl peptidase